MAWPPEQQVEFPAEQAPHRLVMPVCLLFSILCMVIVIIVVSTDKNGPFIGPWG
jgi:hypothetical protein